MGNSSEQNSVSTAAQITLSIQRTSSEAAAAIRTVMKLVITRPSGRMADGEEQNGRDHEERTAHGIALQDGAVGQKSDQHDHDAHGAEQ